MEESAYFVTKMAAGGDHSIIREVNRVQGGSQAVLFQQTFIHRQLGKKIKGESGFADFFFYFDDIGFSLS